MAVAEEEAGIDNGSGIGGGRRRRQLWQPAD
jgi:hypothetical protein